MLFSLRKKSDVTSVARDVRIRTQQSADVASADKLVK